MKLLLLLAILIMPVAITGLFIYNGQHLVTSVNDQYQLAANAGALAAANDVKSEVSYDSSGYGTIQYVIDQTNALTDGNTAFIANMNQLNLGSNLDITSTTLTFPTPTEAVLTSHAEFRPPGVLGGLIAFFHSSADDAIPMTVQGIARIHPNVTGGAGA